MMTYERNKAREILAREIGQGMELIEEEEWSEHAMDDFFFDDEGYWYEVMQEVDVVVQV